MHPSPAPGWRTRLPTTFTASRVAAAVQAAFDLESRELGLKAVLAVDGERMTPSFAAQFGAQPEWLLQTFRDELRSRAEFAGEHWQARTVSESELAELLAAIRLSLRRTRAKMVDADSWVSGGLSWPFRVDDPRIRERGLALYRAPARASATVITAPGRGSIAIPAGDCGEIVSAGLWIPTLLAGDFEFALSYELPQWIAGERESCLGLYAVAADGTFRMYAQRVARAGESPRVVADIDGSPGPTVAPCSDAKGRLRITREASLLSAWHRAGERWSWLGRIREGTPRPLLVGVKVWALGRCGPLRAELADFCLSARAAEEQTPPPPVRPDPRQGS